MFTVRRAVLASLGWALMSSFASAAISLSVDETSVPQGSNVVLTLRGHTTAGEMIKSLTLNAKLNDGATSPSNPVFVSVPSITGTQFQGGDAVESSDATLADFPSYPGFQFDIDTPISPDGILAFLFIDTSMLPLDSNFLIDFNADFPSAFYDESGAEITPSSAGPFAITVVVPEPAALGTLAGLALLATRRRRA